MKGIHSLGIIDCVDHSEACKLYIFSRQQNETDLHLVKTLHYNAEETKERFPLMLNHQIFLNSGIHELKTAVPGPWIPE